MFNSSLKHPTPQITLAAPIIHSILPKPLDAPLKYIIIWFFTQSNCIYIFIIKNHIQHLRHILILVSLITSLRYVTYAWESITFWQCWDRNVRHSREALQERFPSMLRPIGWQWRRHTTWHIAQSTCVCLSLLAAA